MSLSRLFRDEGNSIIDEIRGIDYLIRFYTEVLDNDLLNAGCDVAHIMSSLSSIWRPRPPWRNRTFRNYVSLSRYAQSVRSQTKADPKPMTVQTTMRLLRQAPITKL